jgi:hypothetical protein
MELPTDVIRSIIDIKDSNFVKEVRSQTQVVGIVVSPDFCLEFDDELGGLMTSELTIHYKIKGKYAYVRLSENPFFLSFACFVGQTLIWQLQLFKSKILHDIDYVPYTRSLMKFGKNKMSISHILEYKWVIRGSLTILQDYVKHQEFLDFFITDLVENPYWRKRTTSLPVYNKEWDFRYHAVPQERKLRHIILGVLAPHYLSNRYL